MTHDKKGPGRKSFMNPTSKVSPSDSEVSAVKIINIDRRNEAFCNALCELRKSINEGHAALVRMQERSNREWREYSRKMTCQIGMGVALLIMAIGVLSCRQASEIQSDYLTAVVMHNNIKLKKVLVTEATSAIDNIQRAVMMKGHVCGSGGSRERVHAEDALAHSRKDLSNVVKASTGVLSDGSGLYLTSLDQVLSSGGVCDIVISPFDLSRWRDDFRLSVGSTIDRDRRQIRYLTRKRNILEFLYRKSR